MDASHVYVRALALGCFYSHISTGTFLECADRVAGQLRGDKECPFSGVTRSDRVWRKVPESDARSVRVHRRGQRPPKGLGTDHTPSIAFRHLPPNSDKTVEAT